MAVSLAPLMAAPSHVDVWFPSFFDGLAPSFSSAATAELTPTELSIVDPRSLAGYIQAGQASFNPLDSPTITAELVTVLPSVQCAEAASCELCRASRSPIGAAAIGSQLWHCTAQ